MVCIGKVNVCFVKYEVNIFFVKEFKMWFVILMYFVLRNCIRFFLFVLLKFYIFIFSMNLLRILKDIFMILLGKNF